VCWAKNRELRHCLLAGRPLSSGWQEETASFKNPQVLMMAKFPFSRGHSFKVFQGLFSRQGESHRKARSRHLTACLQKVKVYLKFR
jgi:hypothetical protein